MSDCLSVISNLIHQLFTFQLPWGIGFGAVIVGVFGMPLLVKAFKQLF